MEVGGWVQASLGNKIGKSCQNSPLLVHILIFRGSYVVVCHYDLSVLSCLVHVSDGFPKIYVWIVGSVGGVSSIQVFMDFF